MRAVVAIASLPVFALSVGCSTGGDGEPAQASVQERPARPDWAAQRRARDLAAYVSQCTADFRRCDTAREIVRRLAARYTPGTGRTAIESSVGTASPVIRVGRAPDATAIEATRDRFRVIGLSRTGHRFFVSGTERDPQTWSTSCFPAGRGRCSPEGDWR